MRCPTRREWNKFRLDTMLSIHRSPTLKAFSILVSFILSLCFAGTIRWAFDSLLYPDSSSPNLIDMVMFNEENEIFAVRVHELQSVVSTFFVFEGECDHRGKRRPSSRWDDRLVAEFRDRIRHVLVPCNAMSGGDNWTKERAQREFGKKYVFDQGYDQQTLSIFSDLDEIPKAKYVHEIMRNATLVETLQSDPDFIVRFEADLYYFNVRCRAKEPWMMGPKMGGLVVLEYHDFTDVHHSEWLKGMAAPKVTIPKAAWHFSCFLNVQKIERK